MYPDDGLWQVHYAFICLIMCLSLQYQFSESAHYFFTEADITKARCKYPQLATTAEREGCGE